MKRMLVSMGILLALTVISFLSLHILREECRRYEACAAAAAEAYASGDTEAALTAFDELDAQWEHFVHITSLFIPSDKLDPLYEHLAGLRPMLAQNDPQAAAVLERLRRLIRDIYEEEKPEIWHIL